MQARDLIGVWLIRSFCLEDRQTGERSEPWGRHPSGTVMFTAEGRMFALITPEGRTPPRTEAERAQAFQNMLAYSGIYRIDPPNRLVTTVDISWFAPWIATEQVRLCELDGDDLKLTSAPLHMPRDNGEEALVFAVVTWRREGAPATSR